ncbi:hypothetical protein EVAR_25713_1 [Eumeta japonica]|uniref:Uncharacterized protein n=1 Tax=Eumeta variegata TaxID=151549 RepID=A0A4C1YVI5_EUMVA|nr:hypothetical protein EVAR_25713_1 [Eumeta japonica]
MSTPSVDYLFFWPVMPRYGGAVSNRRCLRGPDAVYKLRSMYGGSRRPCSAPGNAPAGPRRVAGRAATASSLAAARPCSAPSMSHAASSRVTRALDTRVLLSPGRHGPSVGHGDASSTRQQMCPRTSPDTFADDSTSCPHSSYKKWKRRRWWMLAIHRNRTKNSMDNQLAELCVEPSSEFSNFVRMSCSDFEYLLQRYLQWLLKDTDWRDAIPVKVNIKIFSYWR